MRTAEIRRETAETSISLSLSLDGSGMSEIDTGVGFLDHMLTLFARHGRMDLEIHRPDIGGKADQISPVFTAAPRKDAAVSSGLHAPASPPGTAEPAGNRLSSSDAAGSRRIRFAQARKQRNLLDSP